MANPGPGEVGGRLPRLLKRGGGRKSGGSQRACAEGQRRAQPPLSLPPLCLSNIPGDSQTSICITIEPGLLLKGDILVSATSSPNPPFSLCRLRPTLGTGQPLLLGCRTWNCRLPGLLQDLPASDSPAWSIPTLVLASLPWADLAFRDISRETPSV